MPTAEEMDELWAAEHQLNGGPPPGEQHEIKMLEDPAYRATHKARLQRALPSFNKLLHEMMNKERRRGLMVGLAYDQQGVPVGLLTYNPVTHAETCHRCWLEQ